MSARIEYTTEARHALHRLDTGARQRILAAIERLTENPYPPGAICLQGEEKAFRVRVGNYRIIYAVIDGVLLIYTIARRESAYKK